MIEVVRVSYQLYLIPYIKITHDKTLNGNYELIVGWLNIEIVITP